jgi:magnesium transporter
MLCSPQRPKAEFYPGEPGLRARHFIVARLSLLEGGKLHSEQVSIFLGHRTVLTFQQNHGNVWESIRQRIAQTGSRLRSNDPSFLVYSLFDTMVDQCFPILEHYGDELEELEDRILEEGDEEAINEVHHLKRELILLRRALWPMRAVVQTLQREQNECLSDQTRTYFRDVSDNLAHIVDLIETYREVAMGIAETHLSAMSNRLNAVMKVLTIIGTIFIPLTFLAGVYGMNMPIPENHSHLAYPVFWAVCILISGGMLFWFKRRNWI